jgi:glycosyltransferase involved in cell wall biosynthesis
MDETLKVTIIIPTYNCLEKLSRALQSVEKMDFPPDNYEAIVVDDGSSDGTGEYVKDLMGRTKINLHYVYQENRGPAAARNAGIRRAKGKYLLIIDSDCFVDRNILKHYLKHFPDETLGGVGGNVLPDSDNLIAEYLDYTGVWRPGTVNGEITYLVTANAFFLKEAVITAGYFDEDFRLPGGEEPELCHRMKKKGYRFKYDENAVVMHSHRTTLRSMMKMFWTHGKGEGIFVSKWPNDSLYTVFFWQIILGVLPLWKFKSNFVRNLKVSKAFVFFIFDYIRNLAFYGGYRSSRGKLQA